MRNNMIAVYTIYGFDHIVNLLNGPCEFAKHIVEVVLRSGSLEALARYVTAEFDGIENAHERNVPGPNMNSLYE